MSRNQSLTKVVFVMPFIHIFKDPYRTSYQKSVILHFQTFSSNLLDFYIVSWYLCFCAALRAVAARSMPLRAINIRHSPARFCCSMELFAG